MLLFTRLFVYLQYKNIIIIVTIVVFSNLKAVLARTLCVVTLPTSSWQRIVLRFSDYELLKEKCDFYLQNQRFVHEAKRITAVVMCY